ncbi:MAG: hypothetical protein V4596_09630 [Bdellovibrionota bacterium]
MNLTKKTVIVALSLVALSTSAIAGPTGGKPKRTSEDAASSLKGGKKVEGTSEAAAKIREGKSYRLVQDTITKVGVTGIVISGIKINAENQERVTLRLAEALDKNLLGEGAQETLASIAKDPTNEANRALLANLVGLAIRQKLTTENLVFEEMVDGQMTRLNTMDFLNGEAKSIAASGNPKFASFLAKKSQYERTMSSKEAIKKALEELGISYEEFVRRCLKSKA